MIKPPKNYFTNEFIPKLEIGLIYEAKALKQILKYYEKDKIELKRTNDNFKYDFELSNGLKFEVKADIKASITNNIFIENLQFNIASGIDKTKADCYIIIVPMSEYILIKTEIIKNLINDKLYKFIIQPNKNNNFTAGYIFEKHLIINNGILIEIYCFLNINQFKFIIFNYNYHIFNLFYIIICFNKGFNIINCKIHIKQT